MKEESGPEEDDFRSDYNVPDFLQIQSDWTKLILKEKALQHFFARLVVEILKTQEGLSTVNRYWGGKDP